MKAILLDKVVTPIEDVKEWGRWFENNDNRIVKQTKIGQFLFSTVFLGIDHGWDGKSIWFETQVFGGETEMDFLQRYETYEEAEKGHEVAVKLFTK